jgi:hypothetical protein
MEDPRLEIALYKTPIPYQFIIIPYYDQQYLQDHVNNNQVDDSPAELL